MVKFAAGVVDTGGKFATGVVDTGSNFAAGVVDTGDKFATGVADTGGQPWAVNISANFRKNSKRHKWYTPGLGENWFMKKTRSKKSRDTIPLNSYRPKELFKKGNPLKKPANLNQFNC